MKILRKVEDFISFFEKLDFLVSNNHLLLTKTLQTLASFKEENLIKLDETNLVLNLLSDFEIKDLNQAYQFLNTIAGFYSYQSLINNLKRFQTEFLVTHMAFTTEKQINFYNTAEFLNRIYYPQGCIPYQTLDLKTNGINKVEIPPFYEVIIDQIDLTNKKSNMRILYTSDFIFHLDSLPLIENQVLDYPTERYNIFKELLLFLKANDLKINLIVANPNATYLKKSFMASFYSVRSDGKIVNEYFEKIGYDNFNSSKILIENANFVLISKITSNKITELYLILKPEFLANIKDEETLNIIKSFEEIQENVQTLMLN